MVFIFPNLLSPKFNSALTVSQAGLHLYDLDQLSTAEHKKFQWGSILKSKGRPYLLRTTSFAWKV
jgi:hypothetical protein